MIRRIFNFIKLVIFLLGCNGNLIAQCKWVPVGNIGFSPGAVSYTNIVIDPGGIPYVVFQDGDQTNGFDSGKAFVMKYSDGNWSTVGGTAVSAGPAFFTSIALDPTGVPYIVYSDGGISGKTTVKKFDGTSWLTIGNPGFSAASANFDCIVIDRNGTPYVAFGEGVYNSKATVMKYDGSNWVTVGNSGFSGGQIFWISMAIDSHGTPFVGYSDSSNNYKSTVMKFDGNSWINVGVPGFSMGVVTTPSINIDGNDVLFIAYSDEGSNTKSTVMKFNGVNWMPVGNLGFSANTAFWTSIAIDKNGTPYLVYSDGSNALKATVSKFDGTGWGTVGNAGFSVGSTMFNSMAIDSKGTPYVVYEDQGNANKIAVMKYGSDSIIFTNHDTTACLGSTITLNANNLGADFLWNNGATTESISVSMPGIYRVTVSENGCIASDSVDCHFITGPSVNLPKDTSFCSGQSIALNAGNNSASYLWSNNANTESIIISQGGQFSVIATVNGCNTYDTLQVVEKTSPLVFLGNDTALCTGQSLLLTVPVNVHYQYLWQDNSSNNTFLANRPGSYWVKVTSLGNQCTSSDTIKIDFTPPPAFSLGNDTLLCAGQLLRLSIAALQQATYLWNTGATSPSLVINTAGWYWLTVTDNGCSMTDSLLVSYKPVPVISLGNDTDLCTGQTILLNATSNGASYLWQDGSTQPTYTVSQQGTYTVSVNKNGCDTSGKIIVGYNTKPFITLGADSTLCISDHIVLNASFPQSTYLWQDGSTQSAYNVNQAGKYIVQVTNNCGSSSDSVDIQYQDCTCIFYVPSAFTPNGDGHNDLFKPSYKCTFKNYRLNIYSRWGQMVFSTQNIIHGWDGKFENKPQPAGVYIWQMEFFDELLDKIIKKEGSVLLLR